MDMPATFRGFLAEKGSVAIDGVSLTVNSVSENSFKVMLIPFTLSCTSLRYKDNDSRLNIETDILAKYAHSLINRDIDNDPARPGIDKDFLSMHGFM
jgi:riboflavin synthase